MATGYAVRFTEMSRPSTFKPTMAIEIRFWPTVGAPSAVLTSIRKRPRIKVAILTMEEHLDVFWASDSWCGESTSKYSVKST